MSPRPVSILAFLVLSALAGAAAAQLIGPIPPATPPTPEYVPPPPAPKVEVPETDPIAPSIVDRAEDGRLTPVVGSPDQVALARYPFSPDTREKIRKSIEARQLDLDRFVANNVEKVLAARKMEPRVEQAADFGPLFEARDAMASLRFERLMDRLERDRAITPGQKNRLEEALREYDRARKDQIEQDTGRDPTRTAVLVLRQSFGDATLEPFASLERQLDDFIDQGEQVMSRVDYQPGQEKYQPLSKRPQEMPLQEARSRLRRYFTDVLSPEQRRWALTELLAARTPPPAPETPARKPEPDRPGGGH